jgi:ADP-heptose:LPS heptosyltransferase
MEVLEELAAFSRSLPTSLADRIICLFGKTRSLEDLAAMIVLGDILISVDSAPMHLAIGLQKPVVAIFSPTDEKKLTPSQSKIAIAARTDLPCRPCLWDVRQTSCSHPICLDVPVDMVMAQIDTLLDRRPF